MTIDVSILIKIRDWCRRRIGLMTVMSIMSVISHVSHVGYVSYISYTDTKYR